MIHKLKERLVALGPYHWATQLSLCALARRHGCSVRFADDSIHIRAGRRDLVLSCREYINAPMLLRQRELREMYFDMTVPEPNGDVEVWDYSRPGWRFYRHLGIEFYTPAMPEEDPGEGYVHWYTPQPGDVVWDVGAHAGLTTYFLSKMVGRTGRVFAWEPDPLSLSCLIRNLDRHRLDNVVVVPKALAGVSGEVLFAMDGTLASGIVDSLAYGSTRQQGRVEALTLEEACGLYGVPKYVKLDIEGAEVPVLRAARPFLRKHPIHLAVETGHLINGRLTCGDVERLLGDAGYEFESARLSGCLYTWGRPASSGAIPAGEGTEAVLQTA